MKKIILSLMAVGVGLTANAQLEAGKDYIFQHVEAGTFLGGANDWGTHASLVKHGQIFTAEVSGDGFKLNSHVYNSATNHYLGGDYIDATGQVWTAEAVTGGYALKNADGTYLAPGTGTLAVTGSTTAAAWKIIPISDIFNGATQSKPVDVTAIIKNANFSRNSYATAYKNGSGNQKTMESTYPWTLEDATNFNLMGGDVKNMCAESYHSIFNIYQTITVPNGVYALTAQGFYRQDGTDNDNLPVFYANEETCTFPLKTGSENSMSEASASFTSGSYTIDPIILKVTDGSLKVGVKNASNASLWCIWDNFELTYYGADANVKELKLASYIPAYRTALQSAEAVDQSAKMGATELAALKKALEDYPESKVVTSSATAESISAAKTALETAANDAKTSIKKYANDKTRRDQYAARAAAAGVTTVSTAAFDAAYEAGTLNAELADVKTALDTEVGKLVAAYADKSEVITNPSFEYADRPEGWTFNDFGAPAGNKNFGKLTGDIFVEKWTPGPNKLTDGSIKQKVTLPAGVYVLTAEAQLLQQGDATVIPGGMYIFAGENQVEVTNQAETYVVAFNVAADGTEVEIGSKLVNSTGNWASIDHFQIKTLAKVTGAMNAGVKTAQDEAFAAYAADATAEKKAALLEAMANANASVEEYKAIDAAMTATKTAAATYGEATAAAYDDATVKAGYNDGTYNNAAEAKKELNKTLATAVTNNCAAGTDITSLVSNAGCNNGKSAGGWTANPDATTNWYLEDGKHSIIDFGNKMHVNVWSGEGDTDGSNMKTAFTELWGFTPEQDVNVMHDQIEGLAKGSYTVTILARIRNFNSGATTPAGISFKANGTASTTEWTAGVDCSYATLTVDADVTEDGTLDFGFSYVKNDVNFSWLSFKNVTLTYNGNIIKRTTATDKYGTICVPGVVKATDATLYSAEISGEYVTLTEVASPVAGTPYIYKATADAQTFAYGEGGKVASPVEAAPLVGVFAEANAPVDSYVLQTQDGVQAFYKVGATAAVKVPANRAYLAIPASSAKMITIGEDSDATAIKAINALTTGNAKIYDLNGRELKSLQKGVNIVNGVKVYVK